MSLSDGILPYVPVTASLEIPPLEKGKCIQTPEDLVRWMKSIGVKFDFSKVAFGYTAGTIEDASVDDRTLPRFLFDNEGRFIGIAVWSANLGKWETAATLGEFKTINRTKDTVQEDMEYKNLKGAGWYLADGNTIGVPDLTSTDFFQGADPNYDVYTVMYLGI